MNASRYALRYSPFRIKATNICFPMNADYNAIHCSLKLKLKVSSVYSSLSVVVVKYAPTFYYKPSNLKCAQYSQFGIYNFVSISYIFLSKSKYKSLTMWNKFSKSLSPYSSSCVVCFCIYKYTLVVYLYKLFL